VRERASSPQITQINTDFNDQWSIEAEAKTEVKVKVKVKNYPQIGQSNTKKTIYSKPCGGVPLSGG
jgi:hypothetical protein